MSGARLPQHDPEMAERKSNMQIKLHTGTHVLLQVCPQVPEGTELAEEAMPT